MKRFIIPFLGIATFVSAQNDLLVTPDPLPPPTPDDGLPRAAGPALPVTRGAGLWHVHGGAWSRDGKTMVYVRDTDRADIYVIDGFGRPLDGRPRPVTRTERPLKGAPVNPLLRPRIDRVLETGVRSLDALLTLGRGQRVGYRRAGGLPGQT